MTSFARRLWAVLALSVVAIALLVAALVVPVIGVRAPYSPYNPGADGVSSFAIGLHGRSIFTPALRLEEGAASIYAVSFSEFAPAQQGALLVVEPRSEATEAERAWLRTFVDGGGTLIVAARGTLANSFLGAVSETRLVEEAVLDPSYSRAPAFPVVRPAGADGLLAQVSRLVLNNPGAVAPSPNATVLSTTSAHAFLDGDGDGWPSPDEPRGPFPWLVHERLGQGELLVLADPNLLTNGMRDVGDAAAFAANLAQFLETRGHVLIDESHRGESQPLALLDASVGGLPAWLRVGVPLLLYAIGAYLLLRPQEKRARDTASWLRALVSEPPRPPPTRAEALAEILRRHPGWDPVRVSRILDDLEARG